MEGYQVANFHSGLSGLQLPIPKYRFPPEHQQSSRLTYYATFFNSIEINSSFYKIPQKKTLARWAATVPDHFKFTFKLYRDVTHVTDLNYHAEHIPAFMDAIEAVGEKRGALLVQFPPKLSSANLPQADSLLEAIRRADDRNAWDVAVEFRNRSWYNEELYDIIERHRCSVVMHDKPACATPPLHLQSDFVYFRFHGPTGNYRGSYTDDALRDHAGHVREYLEEDQRAYVYFNNTAGEAFENLRSFNSMLTGEA